ncbi:MAG TPA: DUF4838 domain-containing protein, partial [Candidatus Brocadiia bacterium]|nr:DUF4838 domain-containing protein [Candidatus Brocadiia bacterium]
PAPAASVPVTGPARSDDVEVKSDWFVGWLGAKAAGEAAIEMGGYLEKVLGAPVAVGEWRPNKAKHAFLITDVAHAPADIRQALDGKRRDAFAIRYPVKVDGQDVCVLVSQDEQAHDYPAVCFLTRFMDVHWVGPGEIGEVWEKRPDWAMPEKISVLENPAFEMRLWNSQSWKSRKWLAGSGRMGFHHALGHVFHPAKWAEKFPEVYPLVGGNRYIPNLKADGPKALSGWQPCTSNPKSIEIATDYVVEAYTKNPRTASVSLSVNDGAGNVCECASCRALDPPGAMQDGRREALSDRFFAFYNEVARRASAKVPQARIAVLAYGAVRTPPVQVKVDPRIYVFYVQPSLADLKAWKDAGANPNLYMWLWDSGYLTIRPDLKTVSSLIRDAHQKGGIGFYSECLPHWVISAPRFYSIAQVLWDPSRDIYAALDEYLRLAYGPDAAPHVRAFFDQWEAVWRRRPENQRHETAWGWRGPEQFSDLRRDDFLVMDRALASARAASMTEKQRRRLDYLNTYYDLMRINGDEVLSGKELADQKWLESQPPDSVLAVAERGVGLSEQFNRIWSERVVTDRTGWLLDARFHKDPRSLWDGFVCQMRAMVSSAMETATDDALAFMTERMLKKQSKGDVVAYWEGQMKKRPGLEAYIGPRINALKGVVHPNIVVNGGFEEGAPGPTPELPGWDFYEFYGMVKGVTVAHQWGPGTGRDGGKAIALGEGRYPEMKAIVRMEKGRRYAVSFWYKTENRERKPSFSLYYHDGPLTSIRGMDNHKVSRFVEIPLDPTGGQWRQVTRAVRAPYDGDYVVQLASYYHKKGEWTWFDDIEIRKMW